MELQAGRAIAMLDNAISARMKVRTQAEFSTAAEEAKRGHLIGNFPHLCPTKQAISLGACWTRRAADARVEQIGRCSTSWGISCEMLWPETLCLHVMNMREGSQSKAFSLKSSLLCSGHTYCWGGCLTATDHHKLERHHVYSYNAATFM